MIYKMPNEKPDFFTNLPNDKIHGFCEAPEGSPDGGSSVVNIPIDCVNCPIGECHMFKAKFGINGKIIGRSFKNHPPEY